MSDLPGTLGNRRLETGAAPPSGPATHPRSVSLREVKPIRRRKGNKKRRNGGGAQAGDVWKKTTRGNAPCPRAASPPFLTLSPRHELCDAATEGRERRDPCPIPREGNSHPEDRPHRRQPRRHSKLQRATPAHLQLIAEERDLPRPRRSRAPFVYTPPTYYLHHSYLALSRD